MTTATAPKKGKGKSRAERKQEREETSAAQLDKAKELLPSIHKEHQAVVDALEKGLDHAIKAGEHLTAAKNVVGHGGWREWVEKNCEFSYRTARGYVRVYKLKDELPKREEISYRRALLMLRADPTKKPGGKKRKVVRTIALAELERLVAKHRIEAEVDALRPLLESLGIKVKE